MKKPQIIAIDFYDKDGIKLQPLQDAIVEAFCIPKSVIESDVISTATTFAKTTLTKEDLDRILELMQPVQYTRRNIELRLLEAISRHGISDDNLERCEIAINQFNGLEAIEKIPLQKLTMDTAIEALLKVYHDTLSNL